MPRSIVASFVIFALFVAVRGKDASARAPGNNPPPECWSYYSYQYFDSWLANGERGDLALHSPQTPSTIGLLLRAIGFVYTHSGVLVDDGQHIRSNNDDGTDFAAKVEHRISILWDFLLGDLEEGDIYLDPAWLYRPAQIVSQAPSRWTGWSPEPVIEAIWDPTTTRLLKPYVDHRADADALASAMESLNDGYYLHDFVEVGLTPSGSTCSSSILKASQVAWGDDAYTPRVLPDEFLRPAMMTAWNIIQDAAEEIIAQYLPDDAHGQANGIANQVMWCFIDPIDAAHGYVSLPWWPLNWCPYRPDAPAAINAWTADGYSFSPDDLLQPHPYYDPALVDPGYQIGFWIRTTVWVCPPGTDYDFTVACAGGSGDPCF